MGKNRKQLGKGVDWSQVLGPGLRRESLHSRFRQRQRDRRGPGCYDSQGTTLWGSGAKFRLFFPWNCTRARDATRVKSRRRRTRVCGSGYRTCRQLRRPRIFPISFAPSDRAERNHQPARLDIGHCDDAPAKHNAGSFDCSLNGMVRMVEK